MRYPQPKLLVDSRHEHVPHEIDRSGFFELLRTLVDDEAVVCWDRDVAGMVGDDVLVSVHDGGDDENTPQLYRHSVHGRVRVYLTKLAAVWVAERSRWAVTIDGADDVGRPGPRDLEGAIEVLLAR